MLFGACLDGQANFRPYVSEVMPLVIDAIQDITSTSKRLVAVKTLGQVRGEGRLRRWPYARCSVSCLDIQELLVK